MSKKSRRRNQMLAAGLAAIGASKLGMLGGKTASGIAGDKMASARKLMTSDTAMKGSSTRFPKTIMPKGVNVATKVGPGKVVEKDVLQSGPFKMFGVKTDNKVSQSSIDKFKAANKAAEERRSKLKMGDVDRPDVPGFFGMKFKKPLFKSGGSVMAKCKLGRNKKTKIY